MHGNVSEWVWDYYGNYEVTEPTGPASGAMRVYRGGVPPGGNAALVKKLNDSSGAKATPPRDI